MQIYLLAKCLPFVVYVCVSVCVCVSVFLYLYLSFSNCICVCAWPRHRVPPRGQHRPVVARGAHRRVAGPDSAYFPLELSGQLLIAPMARDEAATHVRQLLPDSVYGSTCVCVCVCAA